MTEHKAGERDIVERLLPCPFCGSQPLGRMLFYCATPQCVMDGASPVSRKRWNTRAVSVSPIGEREARFFIDHGMVHDRLTGKHVTTEPDSQFCDGIEHACELLNALAERREARPLKLHFSNDWLRDKIATDPDIETDNKDLTPSASAEGERETER